MKGAEEIKWVVKEKGEIFSMVARAVMSRAAMAARALIAGRPAMVAKTVPHTLEAPHNSQQPLVTLLVLFSGGEVNVGEEKGAVGRGGGGGYRDSGGRLI